MDDLSAARLGDLLADSRIGHPAIVLAQVASTMDVAAEHMLGGAPEGLVVIADQQTGGRGRQGRRWHAPPGAALLMSIVFRPRLDPARGGEVLMAVSLGARAALVDALGDRGRVGLKWPNDILVGDDKIGGVLAEASWPPAGPGEVVVGVGINVSQSAEELPPRATSFVTLGADVPERTELAAAVIRETEGYYRRLVQGESLVSVWAEALVTIGRPVTALTADGRVEGRAIDVADDGALRVLTTGGRLVTLHEGDVSLGHRMEGERENDCA